MIDPELVKFLRTCYYRFHATYDESSDQICYMTTDGVQCRPAEVWEKAMAVLYWRTRNKSTFFDDISQRKLNKRNVLKLIQYFALCYSKLRDPQIEADYPHVKELRLQAHQNDAEAVKRIKAETLSYYSYGWRVNRIYTPDQYLSTSKANRAKGVGSQRQSCPLTLSDYRTAYQAALNDRRNGCAYIKSLPQSGEEVERFLQVVSSVPVYDRGMNDKLKDDSAVCTVDSNSYKCNIYVGDVLFGVLSALLRMVRPEEDPTGQLHDLLIDTGLYADTGRMDWMRSLYKKLFRLLEPKRTITVQHNGSCTGKDKVCEVFPNNSASAMKPFEYLALQCKNSGGKYDYHHIVIRVDGSKEDVKSFFHISAHEFTTTILSTKTEEEVTADSLTSMSGFGKSDVYVALVNFYDVIETVFRRYCEKYFK